MLAVIKVNAVMLSVILLNVIMQILIILSIITLSVVECHYDFIVQSCTYIVPNVIILIS
jgi:hypothetical protein